MVEFIENEDVSVSSDLMEDGFVVIDGKRLVGRNKAVL